MQQRKDSLVSIGEVFSGLDDGPVKELREASPQALHHFTQADQVNQLVEAREADPDLGFMARMMALCSLPRTNPGNRIQYKRVNGPYTLYMTAGGGCKLPFGNLPRLILAWLSTEAVRTQSRELVLGRSLAEFMRALGIYNSGGQPQTRLRNQMDRLFHASVQLIYEDEGNKAGISSFVADRTEFWWNERKPDQSSLWQSKIELSEKFFNEIIRNPVPLDMNTLKALKGPMCRLLALLDPLLRRAALVVEPHQRTTRQAHIRHDEPDARKQLTLVVLHLGDNPPRPRPTLRLIAKALVAHEGFATGSPRRTKQDVFDLQLQVPVGRDADHEPLLVDRVPLLRPFTKSFLVGRPVVECCRIEVSSIGPDKRVNFRVHLHLFE